MAISTTAGDAASGWRALPHRWPTALGLSAAALQLALGPDTETVTTVIIVALLCYLGAAALDRRWVAWAGCAVFSVFVAASQILDLTWWVVGAVLALILVVAGLVLRVPRPPLTAQTAALLGYGAVAVIALSLEPRVGLALAGLALAAHGVWDVIHYRRDVVVHRSLAEFCVLLDVPLGVAAIVLAITG
ncbi:hypothetical protein WEI85_37780 [Actinomycetes bacterium KLBMP 9797]